MYERSSPFRHSSTMSQNILGSTVAARDDRPKHSGTPQRGKRIARRSNPCGPQIVPLSSANSRAASLTLDVSLASNRCVLCSTRFRDPNEEGGVPLMRPYAHLPLRAAFPMQGSDSKLAVAVPFVAVYQKRGLHVGIYTAADRTI